MANNRMWLIHRPSQLGTLLGKRMGWGWYQAPNQKRMEKFFAYLSSHYDDQDDFILAMEDCEDSSCFSDWQYIEEKENGFMKFKIRSTPHIPDRLRRGLLGWIGRCLVNWGLSLAHIRNGSGL
jgi:hypothetical protein